MSVRFENAPMVTARLSEATVQSAGSSPDRESPAEHYVRQGRQFGTDSLAFQQRPPATRPLVPAAMAPAKPHRPWYLDPLASGILAAALGLALAYLVGGLALAIVLALTLLTGLLLYGLGFDFRRRTFVSLSPPTIRTAGTGPLV